MNSLWEDIWLKLTLYDRISGYDELEDSMNIEWESIRMSLTLDWISGLEADSFNRYLKVIERNTRRYSTCAQLISQDSGVASELDLDIRTDRDIANQDGRLDEDNMVKEERKYGNLNQENIVNSSSESNTEPVSDISPEPEFVPEPDLSPEPDPAPEKNYAGTPAPGEININFKKCKKGIKLYRQESLRETKSEDHLHLAESLREEKKPKKESSKSKQDLVEIEDQLCKLLDARWRMEDQRCSLPVKEKKTSAVKRIFRRQAEVDVIDSTGKCQKIEFRATVPVKQRKPTQY
ncbi:uncharacterized protein LOC111701519 [Eurytemora carolleeae]|uniref:uncharacterized protein LOC111701519 n=1 Tax=Eurytemora carolleeae TaxID=1294199 RepID=UPI000C7796D5|nr:uncharacterized protein LOC111701519 [Eurytemora carolleeae]|eukprot:XP_023328595.1 uncharacterized protein LOC111701519 [Eurytemora affinis]